MYTILVWVKNSEHYNREGKRGSVRNNKYGYKNGFEIAILHKKFIYSLIFFTHKKF